MKRLALTAILVVSLAAPAWAGSDEAVAAYERGDYETAYREFLSLAEQGDAIAQIYLDDLDGLRAYQSGDYATALRKWNPLAEQGHADAQFGLGFMYYFGDRRSFDPEAIPLDDAEAAKWFRLAAEQGHADAQAYLGRMYSNGEGVPQDDVQAYKWFTLVADTSDSKEFGEGVQAVLQSRNELEAKMTSDQIAEAQRLAREWLARHQKGGSE